MFRFSTAIFCVGHYRVTGQGVKSCIDASMQDLTPFALARFDAFALRLAEGWPNANADRTCGTNNWLGFTIPADGSNKHVIATALTAKALNKKVAIYTNGCQSTYTNWHNVYVIQIVA